MSSLKHPVGPQPSRVYWRRRLVVGLGLLAIVVVILLIVFAPRGKSDASAPVATHTTTSTPTASSSAAHSSTPKPAATTSAPLPTTKTTAAAKACDPSVVDVEAITDEDSYAAGKLPKLSFSITNTAATPCTFDVGTAKQAFTITSGAEVYWKSTDCQVKPTNTVVLLEPAKTLTSAPIVWDRTRSDPATCTAKQRPAVPAGGASYHLKVTVNGVDSSGTKQFLLY